jgi:uncharacterized membrane protein YciS (DUF1049 family)
MTLLEVLFILISFLCGIMVSIFIFSFYLNNLKQQIMKLEKQVYYWSRQIPIVKRGRRPKGKSVIIHDRR